MVDVTKLQKIKETLQECKPGDGSDDKIIACLHHLSEFCKDSDDKSKHLLQVFSFDDLTDIICNSNNNDIITAYQFCIQCIINGLSGVEIVKKRSREQAKLDKERTLSVGEAIGNRIQKKIDEELCKKNDAILFEIILRIIRRSSSYIITANARDCLLALAMRNIDCNGLNYGVRVVEEGCLSILLDIASEVTDIKDLSSMDISNITHSLVSGVLDRIYSCHESDAAREKFRVVVQDYLNNKLRNPDMDDKIRVAKLFTVLMAGPSEIGNSCIGQTGMIEMILAMASSDEVKLQKAGLDAIIAAASKADKCKAIASQGEQILRRLKESKDEEIRLRALVGLSKVGSLGSTDASVRPFSKDANPEFARDCRAIIKRPSPELTMKQHAIEALAYLSFDGDVKEELVADDQALTALFESLTFDINSPVVYPILTIFVNLTNSYNKQETAPELLELAKFAHQHIPEEHDKDKREYVEKRLARLAQSELVPALVQLSGIDSKSSKELIGRILNALCELDSLRGRLVQQGAVKLLMAIAITDDKHPCKAALLSSQALARLGITINPEFVFPGQRLISVIRPLKRLLSPDCNALQNFEGLMALTNFAQANDDARAHIIDENGFSLIENLMFEEHTLIRRAAVQCVTNLILDPHLVSLYEAENDRVKYLVILCQEDDLDTVSAASGALAMLCQISEKACERLFSAKQWLETLVILLSNENMQLVHRGASIVNSLVKSKNENLGQRVFESNLFEVLLALSLPQVSNVPSQVKELVKSILEVGKKRQLIQDTSMLNHLSQEEEE